MRCLSTPVVIPRGAHLGYIFWALLFLVLIIVSGCAQSADTRERDIVQNQQKHYLESQPPPFFEKSLERYLMDQLYRARNNAVATYSYVQSPFTGKILWECPSVGYPIPGGTQLTNPEALAYPNSGGATLPQAEPNGLFSPPTAMGTYVMCVNDDGTVAPAYKEEPVSTSPYPVQEIDGKVMRVPGSKSNINIDKTGYVNLGTTAPQPSPTKR